MAEGGWRISPGFFRFPESAILHPPSVILKNMSKTLLLGPAGCGKTHQLLDSFGQALVRAADPLAADLFFVVPSAEHTERVVSLLIQRGLKGFFHKRVTTLSRLTDDIFRVSDLPVASSLTRTLMVRDLVRANAWDYFEGVREQPGFIGLMAQFVTELKEACLPPEVFRERMNALKGFEPVYGAKYEALADFYEQYEAQLKARGLRDSQDALRLFRAKKSNAEASPFRFRSVWIDGFFDFSNLQLEYLRELSAITENITITLTQEDREDAFEAVRRTQEDLEKLGFKTQFMKAHSYRTEKTSLLFLQKNLFKETAVASMSFPHVVSGNPERGSPMKAFGDDKNTAETGDRHLLDLRSQISNSREEPVPKDIVLLDAIGTEGEIELIARQIHKLYAAGEYRYSDFAVLFRQIRHYAPVIASVFARYGIPAEVHERDQLKFSSWIAAASSLLSIFREGWRREDVFAFLKSGYTRQWGKNTSKDAEWLALLEQRAFLEGVAGMREAWLADWTRGPREELAEFNKRKSEAFKALAEVEDGFRAAKTAEEHVRIFKRAVYETFGILEISDRYTTFTRRDAACVKRFEALLEEIQSYFLKRGPHNGRHCEEPRRGDVASSLRKSEIASSQFSIKNLEKIGTALASNIKPEESQAPSARNDIMFESFADHFLGLVELDVYSLHERDKNRVQVYDVSLARQKEYKVVFVAGLLEKVFPMQVREDPLLSDWERKLMNGGLKHPLAERLPRQDIERLFFYMAVTRAKERLYLSYPHLDFEGKESLPSFYLEEVKDLFGGRLPVIRQDLAKPFPGPGEAITRRELEASVVGALRTSTETDPALQGALAQLAADLRSRDRLLAALEPVEAKILDKKILEGGYFEIEETSPTRLETYAKCPFRYFADKILKLQDTGEDISAMQKGSILHHVLQQYFDPKRLSSTKETVEQFIEREIAEGLKRHPMIWTEPYKEALDRSELFRMLLDFLQFETERLKTSSFKPCRVEYAFGEFGDDHDAPALEIEGEGRKIKLRGRVDRIDTDRDGKFAVVMDYKRSYKFKAANLELGTALQLPLYLLAAEKHLGLAPLGGEIYSIRDHKKTGFYCEGIAKLFEKEFSPRSHLSEEVFGKVLGRARVFVLKFMKEIAAAEIPVRPRDCESFCPYDTVCRVEKWRLPVILEEIKAEDRADPALAPFRPAGAETE
jgi:ATP-dependent helicase/nuclease subunit B